MANIGNIKNFFVTWFDESTNYTTSQDITTDVLGVSFTDTGSGQVNECILKLSGAFGNFISDSGSKSVIDQYDRFRIDAEDLAGNTYSRYFEFNPLVVPSETKTEGTLLELNLIGIEYHTQRVNFSGRFFFSDAFNVAQTIGESYNENKNSNQPVLSGHSIGYSQSSGTGNAFPKFTVNHYEYGLVEDTSYNRWQQMLDKLGASVANGGILDYFDCGFETPTVNAINIALFSQGSRTVDITDDGNIPTIVQSLAVNVGATDVGIAAATATQVAAWGSQTHGTLPTGHSKYVSGVDQFIFRPLWLNTIPYKKDSLVKYHDNKHYKALNDITQLIPPPPPPDVATGDWLQIDMGDEFGDAIQYSEWTDDKVREWANCGANPSSVSQTQEVVTSTNATMFDINIVVLDNTVDAKFFRTWVDFAANNTTQLTTAANNWAYSGQINQFPKGRRCLVRGNGSGVFNGNDKNGIPFSNNIVEWDGEEWIVKYRPANTGTDLDNMQVVVIDESNIYQWDTAASPNSWSLVQGDLAVDCLHKYSTISSAPSFDPKPSETDSTDHPDVTKDGQPFATNVFSALEFKYTIGQNYQSRTAAGSNTPLGDFYKKGAWAVFRIPFSPNNYGNSVTIGNVYGKQLGTQPNVGPDRFQPAFIDTQNMTWTGRGTRGFNQANSEDLGQLQEVAATIKVTNQTIAGTKLDGPTIVRVWMVDRYDNTVYYDIEIPFVDVFYPIKIPFSSFKVYRGRKPRFFDLQLNNISTLVLPQELEIINRFAFREIQMVGFQIQDFYDEFGRYAPDIFGDGKDFDINNTSLAKIFGGTLALTIDDFHFTKPLLAIARQGTSRNLETQFKKRPHIMTFKQLQNDAATELEKEQFQLRQYEIETAGEKMFDIKFGDSFFFQNPRLVNEQDDSTNPTLKKIKLVARHIQYNFTSPGTGEGGLTRTITSVKRFL